MIDVFNSDTLIAAVIGAVVGSVTTITADALKQKREVRLNLISELITIGHDILASLEELQTAKESKDVSLARSRISFITRRIGDLKALQTRYWLFFPKRIPRMTLNHFIIRCYTVKEYLSGEIRTSQDANMAISWHGDGLQELVNIATEYAGFPMRVPAGLHFLGFREGTPEDDRLLSAQDEAPPWEFNFSFQVRTDDLALKDKITKNVESQAKHLKCGIHNRRAHIIFSGTIDNFDIQIIVCCTEFGETVLKAITDGNRDTQNKHYKIHNKHK